MSEKRKPIMIFLLRKQGKKSVKAELFDARKNWQNMIPRQCFARLFRIRANGKWVKREGENHSFFTMYEFRDMLFRSVKQALGTSGTKNSL